MTGFLLNQMLNIIISNEELHPNLPAVSCVYYVTSGKWHLSYSIISYTFLGDSAYVFEENTILIFFNKFIKLGKSIIFYISFKTISH